MFDWVLKTPVPRINPWLSLSSLNHGFTCLGKYSLTSFILKYQSFIKTIGHLNLWSHETFADHFTFSKATSNLDFYLLVFLMFSTNCLWVWRLKDWKKFSRVTNPEIMNFQIYIIVKIIISVEYLISIFLISTLYLKHVSLFLKSSTKSYYEPHSLWKTLSHKS